MAEAGLPDLRFWVDGVEYAHRAGRVQFHRLVAYARGRPCELSWSVTGGCGVDTSDDFAGKAIVLEADEGSGFVRVFAGTCEDGPSITHANGYVRSYTARDMRSLGDHVPVTNPEDGSDRIGFNLEELDPDRRDTRLGLSVGEIFAFVLGAPENAVALDALGIGDYSGAGGWGASATAVGSGSSVTVTVVDGGYDYSTLNPPSVVLVGGGGTYTSATATVSGGVVTGISVSGASGYTGNPRVMISTVSLTTLQDLALLTVEPPHPVYCSGERILTSLDATLSGIAPNHLMVVKPDGIIRFLPMVGRTAYPVAMDSMTATNPVDVSALNLSRSTGRCSTRIRLRGGPDNVPVVFSDADGTIEPDWDWGTYTTSPQAEDYWSLPDFNAPAEVTGYCYFGSTTEVYCNPEEASQAWATDEWDQGATGRKGVVTLVDTAATGIDQLFSSPVVSNTALAGASAYSLVTLLRAAPATSYRKFRLYGTSGGASVVWRKYRVTDPDQAAGLQARFAFPVAFRAPSGAATEQLTVPVCSILKSDTGGPPYQVSTCPVDVQPDTGHFVTRFPVTTFYGNQSNLMTPGGADDSNIPDAVQVFAPVNRGNLEVISPADISSVPQYSGTAYTVDGIERTLTVTVPSWINGANQSNMVAYAADLLASVRDAEVTGSISLLGWASSWINNPDRAVELVAQYPHYWEDQELPVVECVVDFDGGPMLYRTTLHVSTKRAAFGADMYQRPPGLGYILGAEYGGGIMGGAASFVGFTGAIGQPMPGTAFLGSAGLSMGNAAGMLAMKNVAKLSPGGGASNDGRSAMQVQKDMRAIPAGEKGGASLSAPERLRAMVANGGVTPSASQRQTQLRQYNIKAMASRLSGTASPLPGIGGDWLKRRRGF
jgi:hypothetical protein